MADQQRAGTAGADIDIIGISPVVSTEQSGAFRAADGGVAEKDRPGAKTLGVGAADDGAFVDEQTARITALRTHAVGGGKRQRSGALLRDAVRAADAVGDGILKTKDVRPPHRDGPVAVQIYKQALVRGGAAYRGGAPVGGGQHADITGQGHGAVGRAVGDQRKIEAGAIVEREPARENGVGRESRGKIARQGTREDTVDDGIVPVRRGVKIGDSRGGDKIGPRDRRQGNGDRKGGYGEQGRAGHGEASLGCCHGVEGGILV